MTLPIPGEVFGHPYDGWREHQEAIAEQLVSWLEDSTSPRYGILIAPTGTGKSLLAAMAGRITDMKLFALTSTKQLQRQYERSFDGHMGVLVGKGEFLCNLTNDGATTAADMGGACSKCQVRKDSGCDYYNTRGEALRYPMVTINYTKWRYMKWERMRGSIFSDYNLLVCDEADLLLDETTAAATMEYSWRQLDAILTTARQMEITTPNYPSVEDALDYAGWMKWMLAVAPLITQRIEEIQDEISNTDSDDLESLKRLGKAQGPLMRFESEVAGMLGSSSAVIVQYKDSDKTGIKFEPVQPVGEFERLIDDASCDKVLMMTATPPPPDFLQTFLGIDTDDVHVIKVESTFDPTNAPIDQSLSPVSTTWKDRQKNPQLWNDWADEIDDVVNRVRGRPSGGLLNKDSNILLYVRSNTDARSYKERSYAEGWLLDYLPETHMGREDVINEFQASMQCMLLGTGIERGIDLYGDDCRLLIVGKLGWMNPTDPMHKARNGIYSDYTKVIEAQDFAQLVGRVVRAEDDAAITVIVDKGWPYWLKAHKRYLPAEVLERINTGKGEWQNITTDWREEPRVEQPSVRGENIVLTEGYTEDYDHKEQCMDCKEWQYIIYVTELGNKHYRTCHVLVCEKAGIECKIQERPDADTDPF